jgi:hypothetical protein
MLLLMLELTILVIAVACAPAMLYGVWAGVRRDRGEAAPELRHLVRAAWGAVAPWLELLGYVAGRVLAPARERPTPALLAAPDYVEPAGPVGAGEGIVGGVAATATGAAKPIATPQSGGNDAVVIAALARLVAAGKLGQTDAIKLGLQVAPSSTSARYAEARAALRAEVERLSGGPQFNLTPEQAEWRKRMGLEEAA